MTRNVETLDRHAPESALKAIFDRGTVAVIADNERFWVSSPAAMC